MAEPKRLNYLQTPSVHPILALGEFVASTTIGNTIRPLIDGLEYFSQLGVEVGRLIEAKGPSRIFYLAGWCIDLIAGGKPSFTLPGRPQTFVLDVLAMLKAGVDVRILGWVNPLVSTVFGKKAHLPSINEPTLASIQVLRYYARTYANVEFSNFCLNTLAHPLGAIHAKIAIVGDASGSRGYVSGMDFVQNRLDVSTHNFQKPGWHDAALQVEGSAVIQIHGFFAQMWNELLSRPAEVIVSRLPDMLNYEGPSALTSKARICPKLASSAAPNGSVHVQILRTIPAQHVSIMGGSSWYAKALVALGRGSGAYARIPWGSAPVGMFEVAPALRHAIERANDYIYVEDQAHRSWALMEAIHLRLAQQPNLKVIFVHGTDPADGDDSRSTATAINNHLIKNRRDFISRLAYFDYTGTVVHSKLWLVDDAVAIVGSANMMGRSMYCDGELSLAVVDAGDTSAGDNLVRSLRLRLWGEHCGIYDMALSGERLSDPRKAIGIWNSDWCANQPPAKLRPELVPMSLPLRITKYMTEDELKVLEPDSRDEFPAIGDKIMEALGDLAASGMKKVFPS